MFLNVMLYINPRKYLHELLNNLISINIMKDFKINLKHHLIFNLILNDEIVSYKKKTNIKLFSHYECG